MSFDRTMRLLLVVRNILRRPDELFAHDTSVVDNVGRRRTCAA